MPPKLLLIILDGVGEAPDSPGNAVKQAQMPFFDHLYATYPWTLVNASGNAVGIPAGVQGASEPGHLTMGAGRIVFQPFEEINQAIQKKSFFTNQKFLDCISFVKKNNGALHLLGMLSDGGVHSHLSHLRALLELAKKKGVKKVLIHGITDGRDVPEQSALQYIQQVRQWTEELGVGQLVTLIGRYYAMDRDKNYDRTKVAYDLLVHGQGDAYDKAETALQHFYSTAKEELATDYYLPATKLVNSPPPVGGDEGEGVGVGCIQPGDGIIFFNFRSDRERQIAAAFAGKDFNYFPIEEQCAFPNVHFVCMGPYSEILPVAFPPNVVKNNVGSWLSQKGIKQLRIAETEKYAHVTYFFNSQTEDPSPGEERILIDSPKVPNYAQQPEMSAYPLTERTIQELQKKKYDFVLLNFANGDLVGHSGDLEAAKKAMAVLDECVGTIVPGALENDYTILITADHGNVESMLTADNQQNPSHTHNPVRTILITPEKKELSLKEGLGLASIGTTVIKLLGLDLPPEMDAETLL